MSDALPQNGEARLAFEKGLTEGGHDRTPGSDRRRAARAAGRGVATPGGQGAGGRRFQRRKDRARSAGIGAVPAMAPRDMLIDDIPATSSWLFACQFGGRVATDGARVV